MNVPYDMVIVGGGPAGLSLACLAGELGIRIAVLDKQREDQLAAPAADGRDIALTHRSVAILRRLGVWSAISAVELAPIKRACVRNADQRHVLRFDLHDGGHAALGYLVSNQVLRTELYRAAKRLDGVDILTGAGADGLDLKGALAKVTLASGEVLRTRLVVAADSRFSSLRRQAGIGADMRDFGRTCIVCRLKHESPHDGTAYEWFDTDRTLAVLPLNGCQSSIVITQPTASAAATMALPADIFAADITQRLARRWGEMTLVGDRHAYPLVGVYADRFCARHFALVGDAAVGMHPVSAHGFNLGLMGAYTLASRIAGAVVAGLNVGADSVLDRYDRAHRRATYPFYMATNALVRLYTDNGTLARVARGAILRIGDRLTPIKDLMLRKLMEVDEVPRSRDALAFEAYDARAELGDACAAAARGNRWKPGADHDE